MLALRRLGPIRKVLRRVSMVVTPAFLARCWRPGRADGTLFKVDPITRKVIKTFDSHTKDPGVVVALGHTIWVCDCGEHRLVEFDPANDKVARTLTFAQAGFLVGLSDPAGATKLWLVDFEAATLTPIDA